MGDGPEAPGPTAEHLQEPQLLPLDVGFASVELRVLEGVPEHELYIVASDAAWSETGMLALFEFIGYVLELPRLCAGFVLTYDLQPSGRPQLDVISDVWSWADEEPRRQKRWRERCLRCKVVVNEGFHFHLARVLLSGVFYVYPPSCITYLVTDSAAPLGGDAVCYEPETGPADPTKHADALSERLEQVCKQVPRQPADGVGPGKRPCTPLSPTGTSPSKRLPPSIDVGFAEVRQGCNSLSGMGFLLVIGRDSEVTDRPLSEMMGFMDDFVDSSHAANGFCITYDFRNLRMPSMSMVTRVAEWGGEPERQQKWERLNLACKVVVSSGFKFQICKGILSTFFFVCPPVCRTFLLTEPDEGEESAVIFEPSASASAVAKVRAGHGAGLEADAQRQAGGQQSKREDGSRTASEAEHRVEVRGPQHEACRESYDALQLHAEMFAYSFF